MVEKKINHTIKAEKKIVYLSYIRLTDRVSKTWFIDDLISRKINVEYWDLISFMRENHEELYEIKPAYLSYIDSFKDLSYRIKRESQKQTIFIILFPYNFETFKVHRMLSKHKVKKVYIDWGAMPVHNHVPNSTTAKKIWRNRKSFKAFSSKLIRTLLKLYQSSPLFIKFKIVFTSGRILENRRQDAERIVPLAFGDYSEFLNHNKGERQKGKKSAVFLDINLPYQSDLKLVSLPSINPEKYYSELDAFFTKIEHELDIEVIIAAHPKSSTNSDNFLNRKVFRMKTAELVRDAEFIISHQSTSISYAVLNYKPILFVYTNDMRLAYETTVVAEIENLAKYLGAQPINISEDLNLEIASTGLVFKHRYDEYVRNYLATEESQKQDPKEVFCDELIKLLEHRKESL